MSCVSNHRACIFSCPISPICDLMNQPLLLSFVHLPCLPYRVLHVLKQPTSPPSSMPTNPRKAAQRRALPGSSLHLLRGRGGHVARPVCSPASRLRAPVGAAATRRPCRQVPLNVLASSRPSSKATIPSRRKRQSRKAYKATREPRLKQTISG